MIDSKEPIRIEISYKTVIFTAAFLIGLWFLFQIREIIVLLFLSIILLAALLKPIEWLSSKKIPRFLSIIIVYLAIILFFSFTFRIIIPPLIAQTSEFISKLPKIISTINNFLIFYQIPVENLSAIMDIQIQQFASNLISISTVIFSSIFLVVILFVLTFYFLLEWKKFIKIISSSFSPHREKKIINIINEVERGLGSWIRGQIILSIVIGVLSFVGLSLLGIPYALPLALVTGILEILPIIGSIISAIPAILVGLTVAPIMGLAVIALYIIIHQMENHLVVPTVMSKAVGLQPAALIIALLIGTKLGGIGGAFLAIPTVVVLKIIIKELIFEDKNLEDIIEEENLSGRE